MAASPPEFRVATVHVNGSTSVELGGEIDLATAAELGARLEAVIDASTGAVTVDLAHVTFLDSSGLKTLMSAHRRLRAEGRRLTLRNPSEMVSRLFTVSGVTATLDVQGSSALSAAAE